MVEGLGLRVEAGEGRGMVDDSEWRVKGFANIQLIL